MRSDQARGFQLLRRRSANAKREVRWARLPDLKRKLATCGQTPLRFTEPGNAAQERRFPARANFSREWCGPPIRRTGEVVPLDVVLLQDLSGSFQNDLSTLRSLVPDLLDSVQDIAADSQFGLASFIDKPILPIGDPDNGVYLYRTEQPLTSDLELLQSTVDDFETISNETTPEASVEGLLQVAVRTEEFGFRDNARRIVIVTTDAPFAQAGDGAEAGITTPNNGDAVLDGNPPGTGEDYPTVEQVRDALDQANITPIFVVARDGANDISLNEQFETYGNLVDELGRGTVVQLSSDSSNLVEAVTEGLGEVLVEDTLTGGAGDDQFIFYRPDDQIDRITDFEPDSDQIVISAVDFGDDIVPGDISEEQFVVGTSAEDESDRFIYNNETGNLFFDPDGTGSAAPTQLVTLDDNPVLSATDLLSI